MKQLICMAIGFCFACGGRSNGPETSFAVAQSAYAPFAPNVSDPQICTWFFVYSTSTPGSGCGDRDLRDHRLLELTFCVSENAPPVASSIAVPAAGLATLHSYDAACSTTDQVAVSGRS